jgi:AraC-like DNA-binding protein
LLLSRTFAPSPELSPFIRRHYVFAADLPQDFEITDSLLSETAFVRILIRGDWARETAPGVWTGADSTLLFGGNSRPVRVRVKGSFTVLGFAIRPSGWKALFSKSAETYADSIVPLADIWGDIAARMTAELQSATEDDAIVAAMERAITAQLNHIGHRKTDEQIAEFERIARIDSTTKILDAAAQLGLSVRQLERRCLESFGITPKTVLRRSRFLDMATAIRGFSTPNEEELAGLRYFDQSHLNREFWRFAGMPPGAFGNATTPLLTAGLQLRDQGKALL